MAFNPDWRIQFSQRWVTVLLTALLLLFATIAGRAGPVKIVGFGDSLMAGYQLGPGEGFTDQLQAALTQQGHDVEVTNAGVSGDTTTGGLARLDWSVPDETDLVILELGANDALRGISPEITRQNLDTMIGKLTGRGINVLLAGMLAPPNMGNNYGSAFNSIFPELADKHNVVLYPFFLDGVAAQPNKLLADGMHPNAVGVEDMVAGILPHVIGMLEQLSE